MIRRTLETLSRAWRFYRLEKERSTPPFHAPGLVLRGFYSKRRDWYPFKEYGPHLFLTDWETEFNLPGVNAFSEKQIVLDKQFFHLVLPRQYNPHFLGTMDSEGFRSCSAHATLAEAIAVYGRVFVKPARGHGGDGVVVINQPDTPRLTSRHVVEAPVPPHPYARAIFPDALNTIRVMTIRDCDGPMIIGAGHRFGTRKSAPVDNLSRGGVVAGVDLETGTISAARCDAGVYPETLHELHPDTGAPILGAAVPGWPAVKQFVLELCQHFRSLEYIGWDIAVTESGPVVIEANAHIPGSDVIQAHRPLLADLRVVEFMARHHVISPRRANVCRRQLGRGT